MLIRRKTAKKDVEFTVKFLSTFCMESQFSFRQKFTDSPADRHTNNLSLISYSAFTTTICILTTILKLKTRQESSLHVTPFITVRNKNNMCSPASIGRTDCGGPNQLPRPQSPLRTWFQGLACPATTPTPPPVVLLRLSSRTETCAEAAIPAMSHTTVPIWVMKATVP